MNASLVPSIVISVFLVLIVLGFIFGYIRGFSKSLIRFIMVLGVGVLAFFVIPAISKAILTLDISKYNIVIGDVQVITIQDLITDLLRQLPFIEDIINASPTFETFLEVLPALIANVVLFVVFFFIFKWLSMIIYWIISAIFFSKKKREGKEKHGFIGAVIGAVQGFVVACIVFIPCFGLIETAQPLVEATQEKIVEGTEDASTQTSFIDGVYYVEGEEGSTGDETTDVDQTDTSETDTNQTDTSSSNNASTSSEAVQDTIRRVEKYTNAFQDNWVYKMLNALGIKKLSVSMFDNLSTMTMNDVEYSLRREITTLAKAYPDVQVITDSNFNIEDNETLEAMKNAINTLYESPTLSGMVQEIVPYAADKWLNGFTFCEISKPTFSDESVQELFDAVLVNLSVSQGDTVKNDIVTGVDLLIITNDAGLLHTIINNGDIMDILRQSENENLISNIIGKALESETLKAVLPKVVNVGMQYVYRALSIDTTTIDKITVSSGDVNWDFERPRLQSIFSNVFKIYDQISNTPEGQSKLENLDFTLLGITFDNIRYSTLLGPSSNQIMNALLNSTEIVGDMGSTLEPFIAKLNEIWADQTISLETTFASIGDALQLAKDLQTSIDNFNVESLGDILTTLTENDALKDVVNELVTTETLVDLGLNEQTAGVVSETISAVINGDYSEESGNSLVTEIEAVKEVYNIANKVLNNDTTENPDAKVEITSEEATSLVGALADSNILLDTISVAGSGVDNIGISSALSDESKTNIETQINSLADSGEYTQETIDKLKDIFGVI